MILPIGFSIPRSKVVVYDGGTSSPLSLILRRKQKKLATVIPGNKSTYIFQTEKEYYHDYQISYFAWTKKKSGWDCLRHYEIMANGCLPLFLEIEKCPSRTMTFFPKQDMIRIFELSRRYDPLDPHWKEEYETMVRRMLDLCQTTLSTIGMAHYLLSSVLSYSAFLSSVEILFLSGMSQRALRPDYQRCLTLHGLKELLGPRCHDYPPISHLYHDYPHPTKPLYGRGFTYSQSLGVMSLLRDHARDTTLQQDIVTGSRYQLIVYGSCHRGMPFWDEVNAAYPPSQIVLICGEDIHSCSFVEMAKEKGYTLFLREWGDEPTSYHEKKEEHDG